MWILLSLLNFHLPERRGPDLNKKSNNNIHSTFESRLISNLKTLPFVDICVQSIKIYKIILLDLLSLTIILTTMLFLFLYNFSSI